MSTESLSDPTQPAQIPASFADVDIRAALKTRPHRAPDYESEDRALAVLATELAVNPRNMLQKLVETALDLCHADTAGISLLEVQDGVKVFRWEALAGVFGELRNSTMPRDASPCGVCIDQNATQLMYLADRCFPALRREPRFVEALLIPFHHQGHPIGTVWVVMHQFDRKFDRENERIIRTLSAFASAGWQLWKASEAKDEFLALLGHELRNPLAAIQSAMRSVQNTDVDEDGRAYALSVVDGEVGILTRLVDDLLDLSRLGHGKLELVKESVDLRTVVKRAVDSSRELMDTLGHKFVVSLPEQPVGMHADPIRLSQLFTNLLENAAKFTPDGGTIWLNLTVDNNAAHIVVEDTGVGIPAEELVTIFEPFKQSVQFRERPNRGLGLGLTLVERLARLHGGTVTASSAGNGQGCKFVVRLPLLAAAPAGGPKQHPPRRRAVTPRRILLVEDNTILACVFALELRLDGHDVRIAPNGQAALATGPEFQPDVVVLDIGLPDIPGHDVARQLRDAAAPSRPILIALTGHVQEEYRRISKEAGCDYHFVKPLDVEVLRNILAGIGTGNEGAAAK